MCLDPITLGVGLALAGAGGAINSYETNRTQAKQIEARNAETMRELERQRQFQANSNATFDKTMGGFAPEAQAQSLADAQTTTAEGLRGNAPTKEMVGAISTSGAPRVVKTNEDRTIADAFGKIDASNLALGKLAGYDQLAFGNKLNLNQSGRDLDLTSDLAKTSAAVSGLEQDAAYKNAFRPNSGLGDILQFAGSVASNQAGRGGSLFKTAAPKANVFNPMQIGALY